MKIITFLTLVILFLACEAPRETTPSGTIEIADGWARPGKSGMMSAAYFNLKNGTSATDTLLSISSDVTSNTQIHESYETEDGLMGMREQAFVVLPIDETIPFEQGGLHIMIIQPERDLLEGDSVVFTLHFSSSDDLEIKLPVRTSLN